MAATVIAAGVTPDFRTITIDRGGADGLAADMAVIAPAGVVGRVVLTAGRAAKVQLLLDRNAAAGALIERTRAQGVVVGGGDELLRLDYVPEVADLVVAGDAVVTSGIDGIFPKGFVIGRVAIDRIHRRDVAADHRDAGGDVRPAGGRARRAQPAPGRATGSAGEESSSENRRDHPGGGGRPRAADHAGALFRARARSRWIW